MPQSPIGAIEAGGTTIRCAVASSFEELRTAEVFEIPTSAPQACLDQIAQYFRSQCAGGNLRSLGIATFGPLDHERFTISATTPKTAWRSINWRRELNARLGSVELAIDTDTNAAVLAEARHGNGQGVELVAYVTVGTGIGGGIAINGVPLRGVSHPEIGHLLVPRAEGDPHQGICAFHRDCLEGFASGAALTHRYGQTASQLDASHEGLNFETHYLAVACVNLSTILSVERIILSGGVMEATGLRQRIAEKTAELLNGYLPQPAFARPAVATIASPAFDHAGLMGAWLLAEALV